MVTIYRFTQKLSIWLELMLFTHLAVSPISVKSQSFMDRYIHRLAPLSPIPQYLNVPNSRNENSQRGVLPVITGPALQPQNILPTPGNAEKVNQDATVERDQMIERELMEDPLIRKQLEWFKKSRPYRDAFENLSQSDPDHFSLTRAEFEVENAYLGDKFAYSQYLTAVKRMATLVRQIIKREGLKVNDLTLNYGIQKLYQRPNLFYDSIRRQIVTVPALKYDFDDFNGQKDLTNLFTSKLLQTGKGQCLSMPLLYLMIAEQLGAKAWLSLAPQHTYIQFAGDGGRLRNFETTNGNLVSAQWLAQSGFITAKALRNKTYLDTLSQRRLYAQCMADLLYEYLQNFEYDDFAEQMKQRTLQIDPNNLRALMIDAGHKKDIAFQEIIAAGKPKPQDLPKYPNAYHAFETMKLAIDKVDGLGYQDMPPEAYQKWLRSVEQEKKRQANIEIKQKMQQEINALKMLKSTFIHKPLN